MKHPIRVPIAVLAILALTFITYPAAAAPADLEAPRDAGWSHSVTAWLTGVVDVVVDALPWGGADGDAQRVTAAGATGGGNSHPTMDPNGVFLSDPTAEPEDTLEDPEP